MESAHDHTGLGHQLWFATRSSRVVALLMLVAAMSVLDLYFTIVTVTSIGMNELNPLARLVLEYESPLALAVWKTLTLVLACGILIKCRDRASAEMGAWAGCVMLGALMHHWSGYHHEYERIRIDPVLVDALGDPTWVRLSDATPEERRAAFERSFGRPMVVAAPMD